MSNSFQFVDSNIYAVQLIGYQINRYLKYQLKLFQQKADVITNLDHQSVIIAS